jgi:hypothetical protein
MFTVFGVVFGVVFGLGYSYLSPATSP